MRSRVPAEAGSVGILNVGAGDTKLSFDHSNPAERIRAARIVRDMLRRGYALLIEVERDGKKAFERAIEFREDVCEYVIADFDPVTAQEADAEEERNGEQDQAEEGAAPAAAAAGTKGQRGRRRAVKAESTRAVAVAPSAGG